MSSDESNREQIEEQEREFIEQYLARVATNLRRQQPGEFSMSIALVNFCAFSTAEANMDCSKTGAGRQLPTDYSIIRSLHGVGLIVVSSGRVMLIAETIAYPGAKFGSRFHIESSMPPTDFRRRAITLESPILWRM